MNKPLSLLLLYSKLGIAAFALVLQIACGGGSGPPTEFELIDVGPVPESRGQPVDQFVRLAFNQEIDKNSASEADFGFFDITHVEESEDLVTAIPFRIEFSANPSVVFLHPEIELPKNATLFVGIIEGFKASSGSETKEVSGFRFYTVKDDTAPQLLAASPDTLSDPIDVSSNFEFIYDEELFSDEKEYLATSFLEEKDHRSDHWTLAEHLETLVLVEGNSITLTSTDTLNYDSEYSVLVSAFIAEDQYGNTESHQYKRYYYSTKPFPADHDIPFSVDYKIFDKQSNAIIGINYQFNELIKISLSGDFVVTTHALPDVLDKFCLHESSSRVFATFKNSEVIRSYDVGTMQEVDVITWSPREPTDYNQGREIEFGDFDIRCTNDALYVTTYRNTDDPSSVSRIELTSPHTQTIMQDSKNIGDMVRLESGEYLVTKFNHSYSRMSTDLYLLQRQGSIFTTQNSWKLHGFAERWYRYPSVFKVDFDTRQLIIANKVYALDNLPGRLRLFEYDEPVLAYDPVKSRLYTRKGVYDLDGFERISRAIIPKADLAEFDLQGNLILIDNDALKFYKIDEITLSTGQFP